MSKLSDVNVISETLLPTPRAIKEKAPLSPKAEQTVANSRKIVQDILDARDPRLFIVVGPCSIHDIAAAEEYAERLLTLSKKVESTLFLVMRVYFSKPRTSVGWKGFINDPYLDDSFRIDEGLLRARQLLVKLADMGLATATEALDSITPQYIDDLICWNAIGARTTESQTHREMASGLSTPVGFKNGTDGNIQVAINALKSSAAGHHFLGINADGQCAVLHTRGNRYGQIVLRGGHSPNYDSVNISLCEQALAKAGLPLNIVVDCSHGNSHKDPRLQPLVLQNCVNQIVEGNKSIVGLMLESNLEFGSQDLGKEGGALRYGVSITDACMDWNSTERCLLEAAEKLEPILSKRRS